MSVGLLAVIALLAAAAVATFWPLRALQRGSAGDDGPTALEIARDAKLGEIRELDLDFRLGKLSVDDYRALNATLQAEAVEIMRQIEGTVPPRLHERA